MNVVSRPAWTLTSFLEWEERQPTKHEFDGTRPVAMVGVSEAHAIIQSNLLREVGNRLDRRRCRVLGSDMKIEAAGRIRYPDALISCAPPERGRRIAGEPVVLFEILSETTAETDLIDKSAEYQATPSVSRYVILYQTRMAALVFARREAGWMAEIVSGPEAALRLPEVDVEIPLVALYETVALPEPPEVETAPPG